jgi:hypothetical protein
MALRPDNETGRVVTLGRLELERAPERDPRGGWLIRVRARYLEGLEPLEARALGAELRDACQLVRRRATPTILTRLEPDVHRNTIRWLMGRGVLAHAAGVEDLLALRAWREERDARRAAQAARRAELEDSPGEGASS